MVLSAIMAGATLAGGALAQETNHIHDDSHEHDSMGELETTCCPTKGDFQLCRYFNSNIPLMFWNFVSMITMDNTHADNELLNYIDERQNEVSYTINQKEFSADKRLEIVDPIRADYESKLSLAMERNLDMSEIIQKNSDINSQIVKEDINLPIPPLTPNDSGVE